MQWGGLKTRGPAWGVRSYVWRGDAMGRAEDPRSGMGCAKLQFGEGMNGAG